MTKELSNDLDTISRALFSGQKSQAKTEAQESFRRVMKLVIAVDTLNQWIVQPSERGVRRGLMYRVWDTGRGEVVLDLFNDQDPHPCDKFQRTSAELAITHAASAILEGKVLK